MLQTRRAQLVSQRAAADARPAAREPLPARTSRLRAGPYADLLPTAEAHRAIVSATANTARSTGARSNAIAAARLA